MKIEIIKVDSGRRCNHPCCKNDPKFITPKGRIKKGRLVAQINLKFFTSKRNKTMNFYYCRPCIDQLLLDCRAKLDSKLWIFS